MSREDDDEWRYTVEQLDERDEHKRQQTELQALREQDPEPGNPTAEGVFFFGLGVAVTVGVILLLLGVV